MATIDKSHPHVVRAREGTAIANFYTRTRRIMVIADETNFADALSALTALQNEVSS